MTHKLQPPLSLRTESHEPSYAATPPQLFDDDCRLPSTANDEKGLLDEGSFSRTDKGVQQPSATSTADLSVRRLSDGRFAGRFTFELTSVASWAVRGDEQRRASSQGVAAGETQRQLAWSSLVSAIEPGQWLSVIHEVDLSPTGQPEYHLRIQGVGLATRDDEARQSAERLAGNLRVTLETGCPELRFSVTSPSRPLRSSERRHTQRIVAGSIQVDEVAHASTGFSAHPSVRRPPVRLPLSAAISQSFLNGTVPALMAIGRPTELRIDLIGRSLDACAVRTIADVGSKLTKLDLCYLRIAVLDESIGPPSSADLKATEDLLGLWVNRKSDVGMRITVSSAAPVPGSMVSIAGQELLQGRIFRCVRAAELKEARPLDLSDSLTAASSVPPLLPSPACMSRLGLPFHFGDVFVRSAPEGLLLGDALTTFSEAPVRLGAHDHQQHFYLIGETGSGKSTAVGNMFLQDIQAGRGAMIIDPKGDLVTEIRERISPEHMDQVLDIDFTDIDRMPGLNPLEIGSGDIELACNQVIQSLTCILQSRYGSVPESMGPLFWMHSRNALSLLILDPTLQHTIPDLLRIYADPAFLAYLLQNCPDESVCEFWRGIARAATGDMSLSSVGSYIVNKYTESTQNPRIRATVGQVKSTFNLREAMDHGRPVLVNLAKGQLNELDTRFIAMLLTSHLNAAASSRVSMPIGARRSFNVYIDEFQNCVTDSPIDSLATLLAEGRAYGVSLRLAHQNLSQLPRHVQDVALSNTSTKIMFRTSAADAEALSQYIRPHYVAHDLTALPDHHAIVRAKLGGVLTPPFAMRSRPPAPVRATPDIEVARRSVVRRPDQETRRQQERARRNAFLPRLRLDDDLLEMSSFAQLKADGVRTLADLAGLGSDKRDEVLGRLKSARDRLMLRTLLERYASSGPG